MPTETAAHPDLSPLLDRGDEGRDLYTCIVLAMIGGAVWGEAGANWNLRAPHGSFIAVMTGAHLTLYVLPNPLRDSAAAWELETRERLEVASPARAGDRKWGLRFPWAGYGPLPWAWHTDRMRAAVDAVLHKHQHDPRYADLIAPLLAQPSPVVRDPDVCVLTINNAGE